MGRVLRTLLSDLAPGPRDSLSGDLSLLLPDRGFRPRSLSGLVVLFLPRLFGSLRSAVGSSEDPLRSFAVFLVEFTEDRLIERTLLACLSPRGPPVSV